VGVELVFESDHIKLRAYQLPSSRRPKYVRGDVDNLIGGVLDAMQDAGTINDDRQVLEVVAMLGDDDATNNS
jgi:Holliday junction resolvase RusA-like endonuclease